LCEPKHAVIESNLALYIFRGEQVPSWPYLRAPVPEVYLASVEHAVELSSFSRFTVKLTPPKQSWNEFYIQYFLLHIYRLQSYKTLKCTIRATGSQSIE